MSWPAPGGTVRFAAGLLGSACIVLGSLTPAYLPQNSPWWDLVRWIGLDNWVGRALGTALVGLGVALLIEAWFRLRPSLYHEVKHWPVTLLWSLPMLFAPPIFSHDAYAYAAEGWLLQNGLNPYLNPISVLPGAFADQTVWLWRYTTAMYPPLSLEMFHGLVALAGNDPYFSTLAMRLAGSGRGRPDRGLPAADRPSDGCRPGDDRLVLGDQPGADHRPGRRRPTTTG